MSSSHSMKYEVHIKGSREDFDQISDLMRQEFKCSGNYTAQNMFRAAENALQIEEEPLFIHIENEDDDGSHGVFESYMNRLDKILPKLAIAAHGRYVDDEGFFVCYHYFPRRKRTWLGG